MKKLVLAVLVSAIGIGCCTSVPPAQKPADTHSLRQYKSVTFHTDVEFNQAGRDILNRAAGKIWTFTNGGAEVRVVYDLDFNSVGSLAMHRNNKDNTMFVTWTGSTVGNGVDSRHPGVRVLAETAWAKDNSMRIVFFGDRIKTNHFESIAMHEFGHAVGFDDLEDSEAIMSGVEHQDREPIIEFTEIDLKHCRDQFICR